MSESTEPLKFDPENVERVTIPPIPRRRVHGQMIMPEDCYRDMVYASDYDKLLSLYRELQPKVLNGLSR